MIATDDIIKFLKKRRYAPMNAEELARNLNVPEEEAKGFRRLLRNLELQGEIVQIKQKQYAIPSKVNLMVGRLTCNPRGFGFVVPVKDVCPDVYVGEEEMGEAMHGDTVVVRLPKATAPWTSRRGRGRGRGGDRKHKRPGSGQIVNVLDHVNETVIGTFNRTKRLGYVAPDNPRLFRDIYVVDDDLEGTKVGLKVLVKVTQWPSRHLAPEGVIVEVLGQDGDPAVDVLSIIHQYQLPNEFRHDIRDEASSIAKKIPPAEPRHRLNLKKERIITIDPDDARDFDDAVSIEKGRDGNWRLGVHVADVSYYVRPGTELDEEARKRGTSVYLPGQVIPMLPTALSEGVCSLMEGQDRLTKSVLMEYSADGKFLSSEIRHSIINVKKRFTYKESGLILSGDRTSAASVTEDLRKMHVLMAELASLLTSKRLERGALELDLPEVSLRLDDRGGVAGTERVERDQSHKIIEEFMLAANEAVARFMHQKKLPCFYRIHQEPDPEEIRDFIAFVEELEGVKINTSRKGDLQRFLNSLQGKPESYTVNLALLRSLKRAEYSGVWGPHFGLAAEHYAHFTSPIRRYPDLMVHRVLDEYLTDRRSPDKIWGRWEENLEAWSDHCSFTERRAEEAEREITKLKLIRHLEDRTEEVMDGVITGVEEFGLFVQLNEFLLDGLIHIRNLADDFYKLDRKRMALVGKQGNVFRIGNKIKVKIERIDIMKREIDFIRAP
ncbi:MAG: ribonuclease R [Planctomycetes bacterium]|nr:ribonuclease R [Planctomycetota bacterium]